jgi:hypothetical protein
VLTKNGVFERKTSSVIHASTEKIRRAELFIGYHKLGATFLPEEILCRTNRHDILKLVIIKISAPYISENETIYSQFNLCEMLGHFVTPK